MNILFIGPYRQNDGWGSSARLYIEALRTTGCNLALRPIYYINDVNTSSDFLEENNSFDKYDAVIQMCLPSEFCYKKFGDEKIIGLFLTETNGILKTTLWGKYISHMDGIFCTNKNEQHAALEYNKNSVDISHPIDMDAFRNANRLNEVPNTYNFYFIGEAVERKNLEALITAFHLEFEPHEDVNLLIKTSLMGADRGAVNNLINNLATQIKNKIRKFGNINRYKKEITLCGSLRDDIYMGLHKSCDCFVMPSRGESVCLPLLEAMAVGNQAIVTADTNMQGLSNKIVVADSVKEPVIVSNPPLKEIYRGTEYWYEISIFDLRKKMREAFVSRKKVDYDMSKFTFTEVGKKMIEGIEHVINNA